VSNETGEADVYVAPFPQASTKVRISTGGGARPRWTGDSRSIVYATPDQKAVVAALSESAIGLQVEGMRELFSLQGVVGGLRYIWDMTADGQRFLVSRQPDNRAQAEITVILNWTNLLRK
jgi:hypothetical protein